MPERAKLPVELRNFPINMDELVASGAVISTVQAFVSRQPSVSAPLQATNLDAAVAVNDGTIQLQANPKAGALLILEPGSGVEERLKVVSVSGASTPFIATVTPAAWFAH